jgi:GNAT superfamily N-acetyltransferase
LVLEKEYREVKHFDTWPERFDDLTEDYDNGYTLLGAFDGEKLVGLACMRGNLIGKNNDTIDLSTCFISKNYRKQGIATKLIDMLKERARQLNAKKMYVSAAPSKNTVHFYMGVGFQVTNEPIREVFDENPTDIHMEFIL